MRVGRRESYEFSGQRVDKICHGDGCESYTLEKCIDLDAAVDPELATAGVRICAETHFSPGKRPSNKIVFRRGETAGTIGCTHVAVMDVTPGELNELVRSVQDGGPEQFKMLGVVSTERFPEVQLSDEDHFFANMSTVQAWVEAGVMNLMAASFQSDEINPYTLGVGMDSRMQTQLLKALNATVPDLVDGVVAEAIEHVAKRAGRDWMSKRYNIFKDLYVLNERVCRSRDVLGVLGRTFPGVEVVKSLADCVERHGSSDWVYGDLVQLKTGGGALASDDALLWMVGSRDRQYAPLFGAIDLPDVVVDKMVDAGTNRYLLSAYGGRKLTPRQYDAIIAEAVERGIHDSFQPGTYEKNFCLSDDWLAASFTGQSNENIAVIASSCLRKMGQDPDDTLAMVVGALDGIRPGGGNIAQDRDSMFRYLAERWNDHATIVSKAISMYDQYSDLPGWVSDWAANGTDFYIRKAVCSLVLPSDVSLRFLLDTNPGIRQRVLNTLQDDIWEDEDFVKSALDVLFSASGGRPEHSELYTFAKKGGPEAQRVIAEYLIANQQNYDYNIMNTLRVLVSGDNLSGGQLHALFSTYHDEDADVFITSHIPDDTLEVAIRSLPTSSIYMKWHLVDLLDEIDARNGVSDGVFDAVTAWAVNGSLTNPDKAIGRLYSVAANDPDKLLHLVQAFPDSGATVRFIKTMLTSEGDSRVLDAAVNGSRDVLAALAGRSDIYTLGDGLVDKLLASGSVNCELYTNKSVRAPDRMAAFRALLGELHSDKMLCPEFVDDYFAVNTMEKVRELKAGSDSVLSFFAGQTKNYEVQRELAEGENEDIILSLINNPHVHIDILTNIVKTDEHSATVVGAAFEKMDESGNVIEMFPGIVETALDTCNPPIIEVLAGSDALNGREDLQLSVFECAEVTDDDRIYENLAQRVDLDIDSELFAKLLDSERVANELSKLTEDIDEYELIDRDWGVTFEDGKEFFEFKLFISNRNELLINLYSNVDALIDSEMEYYLDGMEFREIEDYDTADTNWEIEYTGRGTMYRIRVPRKEDSIEEHDHIFSDEG